MKMRVYKIAQRSGISIDKVIDRLRAMGERHNPKDMVRSRLSSAILLSIATDNTKNPKSAFSLSKPYGEIWSLPEWVIGFSRKSCARPVLVGPLTACGSKVWVIPGTSFVDNNTDRHRGMTVEPCDAVGYRSRGLFLPEQARSVELAILQSAGSRLGYLLPEGQQRLTDELVRVGLGIRLGGLHDYCSLPSASSNI